MTTFARESTRHEARTGPWRAAIGGVLVFGLALGVPAQTAYEVPPVTLPASAVLPPDVVTGPNHRVAAAVTNDGYLNHYRISSTVGEFSAVSTAMLRIRVVEINALVAMSQVETSTEFVTSFEASAKRNIQGIENLVTDPGQTLEGAASGVARLFQRANESLFGSTRSDDEGARYQDVVGYAKTKREVAQQFGVDVYSSNAVLQEHLSKLAQANYWGGMSMAAVTSLVPGGAGLFLTVTGTSRLLNDVIATTPPTDLRRMNREKLEAMGVDPGVAEAFISNAVFSPRQQTVLVAALDEMQGTADRGAFVQFALPTQDGDLAFFRQRMAEMYAGHARNVGGIARFLPMGHFVVARTSQGAMVFCAPLDLLLWTEAAARVVEALDRSAREVGAAEKHLWLTGTASTPARQQLLQRGWTLHEASEAQLWARP